jgi:hypothetical protein
VNRTKHKTQAGGRECRSQNTKTQAGGRELSKQNTGHRHSSSNEYALNRTLRGCAHSLSLSDLPSNNELTCASRAISCRCSLLTLASLLGDAGSVSARRAGGVAVWLAVCSEVLRTKHKTRTGGRECRCRQNTKTQAGGRVQNHAGPIHRFTSRQKNAALTGRGWEMKKPFTEKGSARNIQIQGQEKNLLKTSGEGTRIYQSCPLHKTNCIHLVLVALA